MRGWRRSSHTCAATLDGYIADSDDGLDWLLGYEGSSYEPFYAGVGALVSGSTTYEFVLEHLEKWPYAGKPYWVLSSRELVRPDGAEDEVRIVDASVAEIHDRVVESAGGANAWVVGGGNVASQYAAAGLLDELLLTVVPVVLGAGKPLFEDPLPGPVHLTGTSVFRSGMVELRYEFDSPRSRSAL
ncbi:MAG: dihydrofolate reductase family protein [Solirubrobacterales bacterium]